MSAPIAPPMPPPVETGPGDHVLLAAAAIRIEAAPHDGHGILLLPAFAERHLLVALVRRDDGGWDILRGLVASELAGSPLAAVSAGAHRKRVNPAKLAALGILTGDPTRPVSDARMCLEHRHTATPWAGAGIAALDREDLQAHPARDPEGYRGFRVERGPSHPIQATGERRGERGRRRPSGPTLAAMDRAIADWVAAMRPAILGPVADLGLGDGWTWSLHLWLTDPAHGARRRQAAAIHPVLAPLAMVDRETAAAIDAGLPFEPRLAEALSRWRALKGLPVPSPGLMRRFRSLPNRLMPGDVASLAAIALSMPIDRVPAAGDGWLAMAAHARAAFPLVRRRRAEGDAGWAAELAGHVRFLGKGAVIDTLDRHGLADFADHAGRHLVRPVLAGAGIPSPSNAALRSVARGLLFGGARIDRAARACARWHAEVSRIGWDDDGPGEDATWPALFPPFSAANGVTVRCLVTPAELRAEGLDGPDAEGRDGLAHCVGTYAARCAGGGIHVASVRAPGGERLSTVSVAGPSGRARAPFVEQHRGLRNAPPPPEAVAAVAGLIAELARSPRGIASGAVPCQAGDVPGCAPARAESACRRWLGLVPDHVRRGGIAAIRARILALHDGSDAGP